MPGVKDRDHGYKGLLNRVYGTATPPVIKVGILARDGDAAYDDGVTVLEVAMWNEFGTDKIPERSFLRAWFDDNRDRCRIAVRKMLEQVVTGKYTREQAMQLVAQRFVGEIQKRIAQGIPPANAPSTIARKGSATPLIDTGQLRSSISYEIDGKEGESSAEKGRKKARGKQKKASARAAKKARAARIRTVKKAAKSVFRGTKRFLAKARKAVAGKKRRAPKA